MKIAHIIVTTILLISGCALNAMHNEAKKHKKEFKAKLESARRWGQWRKEAYESRIGASESQASTQPQACASQKPAIPIVPTRIAAQCVQIQNDDRYDPVMQYLNGERDDLDAILNDADNKNKEPRSASFSARANLISEEPDLAPLRIVVPGENDDNYDDFELIASAIAAPVLPDASIKGKE